MYTKKEIDLKLKYLKLLMTLEGNTTSIVNENTVETTLPNSKQVTVTINEIYITVYVSEDNIVKYWYKEDLNQSFQNLIDFINTFKG